MKKTSLFLLIFLCLGITIGLTAQPTYPVNGVHDEREALYAFTNATIHASYDQSVENATLLIRKGKIVAVGTSVTIPDGAVVYDLAGKHIYPAFIDIYSDYGLPPIKKEKPDWNSPPQFVSKKEGAYAWNQAIKPEVNAYELFSVDAKKAEEMRQAGFGAALTHVMDGIARGSGAFVLLADGVRENEAILKDKATAHYSFSKGNSKQDYPSSLMGVIALLRQTHLDAQWYAGTNPTETEYNISLQTWNELQSLPQIFDAGYYINSLRAGKLGNEFGVKYIIKGNGSEYKRLEELKNAAAGYIIPLNFPDAYDVEDPFDAENVNLAQMLHWELAPSNPARLEKAGVAFALTPSGLKKPGDFKKNLLKAIDNGLSKKQVLKSLIYTPAKFAGVYGQVGSLEKGKIANFIITSDDYFEKKSELYETWTKGERHIIKSFEFVDVRGTYNIKAEGLFDYKLAVKGKKPDGAEAKIMLNDSTNIKVKHKVEGKRISLSFNTEKDSLHTEKPGKGIMRLSGWLDQNATRWEGRGQTPAGRPFTWTATRTDDDKTDKKKKKDGDKKDEKADKTTDKSGELRYPFVSYGNVKVPQAETVLFKNATVWTNESDGILENTDVLIQNGKIAEIGEGLKAPAGAKTVDATGKHLTCGIIDEHSHIAISRGVNEGTQASSAEVRIGDVVNSEDVNIYRQLAGGVTTSQLLHGSANPIGGQSALIKLRWGYTPEKMKFEGSDGFIKFALGENVKQSNWGDKNTIRFPQTRMGVEQVFVDGFTRAREYGKRMGNGNKRKGSNAQTQRRDLELEALLEIINKKRFITCHSYVQSEITMLMRVAERFGFKVNTFTHILEGYKVADKMREHGAAGSTFSDWWAYKYEVIDAIPHNAAVLDKMDVLVGINSDDAEMARRLNQEAAKTLRYGGLSPEAAWKTVTLNPAKMLHIDHRVGSIKVGKDADVVLWSHNPLSVYAKAQQTYVDGIRFFDREKDAEKRVEIAEERNRLIQKMLKVKQGGGQTQKARPHKHHHYHCDSEEDEGR